MTDSPFDRLHPAVQYHVVNSLGWASLRPTQLDAIDPILSGKDSLLLAPTAGGKTEAAVIPTLSRMLTENWTGLSVLYVCPIKALLNNLEPRLARFAGYVGRTVGLWHGDVSDRKKLRIRRDPPDVLLTTPESVEGMLLSVRVEKQSLLSFVKVVIVDELHAFAGDDRGWHLRAVLKRLEAYTQSAPQRIGLSATVGNPGELLRWFSSQPDSVQIGTPTPPKGGRLVIDCVGSIPNAATVVSRLYRGAKRLVFCDSRSKVEELASHLRQLEVRTFVSHSSLSASERKKAEEAFAEERDCVIVATSTLELGIDVGDLDHVLQIDSPSSVSSLLQRMGRTGRRIGMERNCTFLATNDEGFLLAGALCRLLADGYTEPVIPPARPWHLVAQQAMALVLERKTLGVRECGDELKAEFPELPGESIESTLSYLIQQDLLWEDGGVLWFGKAGEREFGGRNFLELVSSFTTPTLLLVRHGDVELGVVDPISVRRSDEPSVLSMGGRSWSVQSVDWSKRIAWVEPVAGPGMSRWLGSSRALSFRMCQAIKSILLDGHIPCELSRRATDRLAELVKQHDFLTSDSTDVTREADGRARWWTFAGAAANAVLARQQSSTSLFKSRWDDFSLTVAPDFPVTPVASGASNGDIEALNGSAKSFADEVKFSVCVPEELLYEVVAARLLDRDGAQKVLALPMRIHR